MGKLDIGEIRAKLQSSQYRPVPPPIEHPTSKKQKPKKKKTQAAKDKVTIKLAKYRQRYRRYIQSAKWKTKREEAFTFHGRKCSQCGTSEELQCHHTNYKRLGNEDVATDIEIMCQTCHEIHHGRRFSNGRRINEKRTSLDNDFRDMFR